MKRYSGHEKEGITEVLTTSHNTIDLEVQLPGIRRRLDIVTVRPNGHGHELAFYEAKTLTDQRVRASGDARPEVVEQLETYQKILAERKDEILSSYKVVIKNFLDLEGIPAAKKRILAKVNLDTLELDTKPSLLFVGYDEIAKDKWQQSPHSEKLIRILGKDRVLLKETL